MTSSIIFGSMTISWAMFINLPHSWITLIVLLIVSSYDWATVSSALLYLSPLTNSSGWQKLISPVPLLLSSRSWMRFLKSGVTIYLDRHSLTVHYSKSLWIFVIPNKYREPRFFIQCPYLLGLDETYSWTPTTWSCSILDFTPCHSPHVIELNDLFGRQFCRKLTVLTA